MLNVALLTLTCVTGCWETTVRIKQETGWADRHCGRLEEGINRLNLPEIEFNFSMPKNRLHIYRLRHPDVYGCLTGIVYQNVDFVTSCQVATLTEFVASLSLSLFPSHIVLIVS